MGVPRKAECCAPQVSSGDSLGVPAVGGGVIAPRRIKCVATGGARKEYRPYTVLGCRAAPESARKRARRASMGVPADEQWHNRRRRTEVQRRVAQRPRATDEGNAGAEAKCLCELVSNGQWQRKRYTASYRAEKATPAAPWHSSRRGCEREAGSGRRNGVCRRLSLCSNLASTVA
jgi:hypothetical protein